MFYIWLAVCGAGFLLRTVFNVFNYKKHPLAQNKKVVTAVYIIMAILWFAWFQMVFSDPMALKLPVWLRYAGLAVFIIGVSLFILSHVKLGGFKDKAGLKTSGIYTKIRNPMYLGFILWVTGFPVYTESLLTLATAPVWAACFIFWKVLEEKELAAKYPEYQNYKKGTWF